MHPCPCIDHCCTYSESRLHVSHVFYTLDFHFILLLPHKTVNYHTLRESFERITQRYNTLSISEYRYNMMFNQEPLDLLDYHTNTSPIHSLSSSHFYVRDVAFNHFKTSKLNVVDI
jgi:hypothetical protein